MLTKVTVEDIKKYGEFAYHLAQNPAKSSYPTYCDGIKSRADFLDAASRAAASKTSELLLFSIDGDVLGWISYFWIPEDRYLQLSGCNIHRQTEQALAELLERLEISFAGYTAYFGYPGENHEALRFLQEHGFRCTEQSWNHSFFFEGYKPADYASNIEAISRQNFAKFRAVYHADSETYWNCDRIFETLEDWSVFVYNSGGAPIAAIFLTGADGHFEIYGIEFADGIFRKDISRELLKVSFCACKRQGAKYMTYFCKEEEKRLLNELGFKCVGQYVLYTKAL